MNLWASLFPGLSRPGEGKDRVKESGERFERAALRKPQRMKEGFLWSEGMIVPRACTIRDMSVLGAQIEIWVDDIKPALLRGPLKLYSCADRQEVDCELAQRDGMRLGLRFNSAFHEPSRKYP